MPRIFLTGAPGSSKTAIGHRTADLLGWKFRDTNTILTERTGIPISQILLEHGEDHLNQLEAEILHELASAERVIIATGGERAIPPVRRTFMREHGIIAHLDEQIDANAKGEAQNRLARRLVSQVLVQGHLSVPSLAREVVHLQLEDVTSQAIIEWGGLPHLGPTLRSFAFSERLFLVTDQQVGDLYAAAIKIMLEDVGFQPYLVTIPAGEANKSLECFKHIIDWLAEHKAERHEAIIAVGGGMVGDITGFVASCYKRGVPFIQVPTTLLAQVDSAIGGKTGVNLDSRPNVIGAYYQPALIYVDPALILTLPERVYGEGWAEVVKYAMVMDASLFTLLEEDLALWHNREPALLAEIVTRCIRLKMSVVQYDELDFGPRQILNYGHTFGHALEAATNYETWLHGEAVALGMEVAAHIAMETGRLSPEEAARQTQLLQAFHLPVSCPEIELAPLLDAMQFDKKMREGRMHWILPTQIGHAQVCDDIDLAVVCKAIEVVCGMQREN